MAQPGRNDSDVKLKRNLVFLFFLLAGIIIGALLASLGQQTAFLSWLAYGKTVGISVSDPLILDLSMLRMAFGLEIGINVAQIITITISLLVYKSVAQKL
ncbi:hypothetical protein SDC9_168148 [bioreactor metagenome]|uniref:DUF4321 domain-containing protein n=1 Tax=bioreactor metagenome TaxID=1076179 RepID=A0A645G4Q6_9ZZZZ